LFKAILDTVVPEQRSESSQLVIHESVHRIENESPHPGLVLKANGFVCRLLRKFCEYRQKEALRLTRSGSGRDHQALPLSDRLLKSFGLVLVWGIEEEPAAIYFF
jgi:hypothetical protein